MVCSDSCHCYLARCASPVVVTSTHLSSGNEQMMIQSCDVSPQLHFEIHMSEPNLKLHQSSCVFLLFQTVVSVSGDPPFKPSLSSIAYMYGHNEACSVWYQVCHKPAFGAVKRRLVSTGDAGGGSVWCYSSTWEFCGLTVCWDLSCYCKSCTSFLMCCFSRWTHLTAQNQPMTTADSNGDWNTIHRGCPLHKMRMSPSS